MKNLILLISCLMYLISGAFGKEYPVSTPAEFKKAMDVVKAGDEIIIANGKYNRIDHCTFTGNRDNQELQVRVTAESVPQNTLIDHNLFKEKEKVSWNNGNGGECVQVGQDPIMPGTLNSHTTVRDNQFIHCNGEAKIISNKSSANKYIHNYFEDCQGELVMRGGHDCLVDSNTFKGGSGGIRINETHHIVSNNQLKINVYDF